MHLSDIIKSDSDRLFIVDTECFIIFTGVSINDERPFIRIGTWYDLPVEFIPLVENIIVSDRILGNPSYEQFNIDVRYLEANRYIGGESILKRFLEYQRIFGLDLTNVSLVNIEKDIPELSSQKTVSGRDQFIGIFYTDGNIKINHGKGNLFDLNLINRDNMDTVEILDRISANSKNTTRYKGSGLVVIDNNPIFYQKGYFTSYQFPDKYFHDFSVLQINPGYIRELLLPSQNLINISGFMKFKNRRGGKIKLYSDNIEQTELIKKLFKNATVSDEKFSNLHLNTAEGLKIDSYLNSPNIKLSFKTGEIGVEEIIIPFIKSPVDTAKILKEKSDAIMITYTAYEESALLFKSTETPVVIIDDGNSNIKKLYGSDKIILKPGIQYDLKKYRSSEELLNEFTDLDELKQAIENSDKTRIYELINSTIDNDRNSVEYMNIPGLIKTYMNNTSDRKKYSMLKDIFQDIRVRIIFNPDTVMRSSLKMVLALHNNFCCTLIKKVTSDSPERFIDEYNEHSIDEDFLNNEQRMLGLRILEDRRRLTRLLSIFYKELSATSAFGKIEKEVSLLKNEISTRKDIYNNEFYSVSSSTSGSAGGKRRRKNIIKNDTETSDNHRSSLSSVLNNKKIIIPSAVIILIIVLILISSLYYQKKKSDNSTSVLSEAELRQIENRNIVLTEKEKTPVVTVKRVDQQEKELLVKHKVTITESDIFHYSNDVALKNGYNKITFTGLKQKNPHWIYPNNVFIMLDGEKVVVQKGDTLWDLAHAKLEKMNADFYKIIDEIEDSGFSDKKKIEMLILNAEKYSYLKRQSDILDSYKKRIKNE